MHLINFERIVKKHKFVAFVIYYKNIDRLGIANFDCRHRRIQGVAKGVRVPHGSGDYFFSLINYFFK